MEKDYRPFYLKKTFLMFQDMYVNHFLRPKFNKLGKGYTFIKPWYFRLYGEQISVGNNFNAIADPDNRVSLTVWTNSDEVNGINIGNYCLVCPGVQISASSEINIGDSCMLANGAYITDCDWHDVYNRLSFGSPKPVTIEDNVWVGYRAVVCKGVTIGKNSIIGTGSIVVNDIPPNTVAAGNPAKPVRDLDIEKGFITRENFFSDPVNRYKRYDQLYRQALKGNTTLNWLRTLLLPLRTD